MRRHRIGSSSDCQRSARQYAPLSTECSHAARVLNPDCCCCCCCCGGGGPSPTFAWVAERMDRDGLSFFHSGHLGQAHPGMGWRFRRQHEMVMVAHRTKAKLRWNEDERAVPNIFSYYPPRRSTASKREAARLREVVSIGRVAGRRPRSRPVHGQRHNARAAKDLGRRDRH